MGMSGELSDQNISSLRLMLFIRLVLLNMNSRSIACLCIPSGSAIKKRYAVHETQETWV